MIVVYGLKNCDSCRKARGWLEGQGIAHRFHDLRADGFPGERLPAWLSAVGWETLLNRRGTTWRQLPEETRAGAGAETVAELLEAYPALIKRPVFDLPDGQVVVGFAAAQQAALADVRSK